MNSVDATHLGQLTRPVLLFGGPYSNLPATLAMQAEARRLELSPEQIICSGDLIAYCASPVETIELIQAWGIHCIMGNCEASLADESVDCGCGFKPGSACAVLSDNWFGFANQRVSGEQRQWMQALPRQIRFSMGGHDLVVVHGAPSRINKFIFPSSPRNDKRQELELANATVIIGGHCGIPFGQKIGHQFWLNTGAIGLPANDGTRDGWYLLLTPDGQQIEASWHRLPYDYRLAARQMQEAGLGNAYAEALTSGMWPSMEVLPNRERTQQGQPLKPPPLRL